MDGGSCAVAPEPFSACTVENQVCAGPVACTSCNGFLHLWDLRERWSCYCSEAKWNCASGPVCTEDEQGTFIDDACTIPKQQTDDAGT
jgi:hypothetical protein